ncbi:hypothetical protein NPIL_442841, partial [Nephila pilipes]
KTLRPFLKTLRPFLKIPMMILKKSPYHQKRAKVLFKKRINLLISPITIVHWG